MKGEIYTAGTLLASHDQVPTYLGGKDVQEQREKRQDGKRKKRRKREMSQMMTHKKRKKEKKRIYVEGSNFQT